MNEPICEIDPNAKNASSTLAGNPVVVPNNVSADVANRLYGESFGVDWVYESGTKP